MIPLKELKQINFATLELVYIDEKTNTPYCKIHGAMNKSTNFEDNSGIWRCFSSVSNEVETVCRAGCQY